tara:strand:- start:650 stop:1126 length:477 start_codon:yes stop_codon:yes gene_type:complete
MSTVTKIDGIGTRKDGSGGESANLNTNKRFVRLYATATLAVGDAVCLDTSVSTYGLMNNVTKANVGASATKQAIGVAAEAVTISGTDYQLVNIQVGGLFTTAAIDDTSDAVGDLLAAGATAGQLTLDVAAALPVAILVVEGTAATKDSTIYLLNPANL